MISQELFIFISSKNKQRQNKKIGINARLRSESSLLVYDLLLARFF